jgi:hypothetical protein
MKSGSRRSGGVTVCCGHDAGHSRSSVFGMFPDDGLRKGL